MGSTNFLSTLKKAATVAGDVLTTKGDILSRSASALGRLGIGSNGQVLQADSSETLGIKWATPSTGVSLSADNTFTGKQTFNDSTPAEGNGGKLEHIATYRAGTAESSKDFTSLNINLDTAYSKLILVISGRATAAFNLNMFLNSTTTGGSYNFDILLQDSTTVSGVNVVNQDKCELIPIELIDAARTINVTVEITSEGFNTVFTYKWMGGATSEGIVVGNGTNVSGSGTVITAVGFDTSTSTWQAGTQADLYGERL